MVDRNHVYTHEIRREMAFVVVSLAKVTGGIKSSLDGSEPSTTSNDIEQEE
jgi:hypothetical protein